jgi:hypothetical protein
MEKSIPLTLKRHKIYSILLFAHVMCLLPLLLYHLLYFILVYFCSECFLHIPLLNAVNL